MQGDRALNSVDSHTLRWGAIESDSFLSWGHQRCVRDFFRKILYEADVEYRDSALNDSTSLWW